MNITGQKKFYTVQEYLELEDQNDFKSEYHDGEIFAMSGGSINHSLIGNNFRGELRELLKGKDCYVHGSDLKVSDESLRSYLYPDALVICGQPNFAKDRKDIVTNPILLVEVLSESTSKNDRGWKFQKYRQFDSVQEYVLIEQDLAFIDVVTRNESGNWEIRSYEGLGAQLPLKSLNIEIPFSEIYRGVQFSS
ncbi:MAG: Uma2 family endonuclease [Bacteroidia bacterium]|nr:Uma2 family endonuclease [Bacteroidia bacterium]